MSKEPDFLFNLNVPVNIPSDEEQEMILPHLDEYIKKLIDTGYVSEEEAVAFIKFGSEMGAYLPFMMDAFVQSYRNNKNNKSLRAQLERDAEDAKRIDSKSLIVE